MRKCRKRKKGIKVKTERTGNKRKTKVKTIVRIVIPHNFVSQQSNRGLC